MRVWVQANFLDEQIFWVRKSTKKDIAKLEIQEARVILECLKAEGDGLVSGAERELILDIGGEITGGADFAFLGSHLTWG